MAKQGFSTKKRAAIRALLTGANYPEAAEAARCSTGTIGGWMKDPEFIAELHQAELEAMAAVSRSLVALADKATGTLEDVLDSGSARDTVKLRAADVVLSKLLAIKELAELEERITRLENQNHVT